MNFEIGDKFIIINKTISYASNNLYTIVAKYMTILQEIIYEAPEYHFKIKLSLQDITCLSLINSLHWSKDDMGFQITKYMYSIKHCITSYILTSNNFFDIVDKILSWVDRSCKDVIY